VNVCAFPAFPQDRREELTDADQRIKGRTAEWLSDPKVKDSIRRNHEAMRELKNPRPLRRANG
jgi:hypothetical protein